MYKAIFDDQGNRLTTYIKGVHANIPAEAIPITETEQALYVTGEYIRDMKTGQPMRKPVINPTAEELKAQALAALDAEYQPQFRELQLAWAAASMAGDTDLAEDVVAANAALKAEYQTKLEAIDHG